MRASFALALLCSAATVACRSQSFQSFKGSAADSAYLQHHQFSMSQMPAPFATESAERSSHITSPPKDARLHLPPGFAISTYAQGFHNPRWMALAPNGDVFVAESDAGRVTILRDSHHSGRPDQRFVYATGLNLPFGMAFHGDYFYVAETSGVLRYPYHSGDTHPAGRPQRIIELPAHGYNMHWTRDLLVSPDGKNIFVSVGSQSNDTASDDPRRAAISEYNLDGSGGKVFAGGLRNAVGIAFYPGTDTLWATINERDGLGDELPPDYFTHVQSGGFYGWPYAYIGPHPDPNNGQKNPGLVKKTIIPDLLIQPHSAPLGVAFYRGSMFPPDYHGDALIALHGSWNRARLTGYKIIRVHFKDGKPVGGYDDFINGWLPSPNGRDAWGRPVGLLVLPDGSLLITDDGADEIWRVTYQK